MTSLFKIRHLSHSSPCVVVLRLLLLVMMMQSLMIEARFTIDAKTLQIVDQEGREVYFHGVNVYLGSSPDNHTLTLEEMRRAMDLGLNIIRLAFDWKGLEPVRHQYNMSYVGYLHRIVQQMNTLGIYAILDAHQDCLSPKFCGDGVPDWAAHPRPNAAPFPEPIDNRYELDNTTGYPSPNDCARHYWGLYCASEAGASAIQNFYDNYDGILDSFSNWWQFMAKQFGNYSNVIGYDLLNEPFAGDIYYNPQLLLPSVADVVNLMPMYHRVANAIRQVDQEKLIFFEPVTWSDFGVAFPSVPGGEQYRNRSVLSYHYYVPPNTIQSDYFPMRVNDSKRLQCGHMLTEFDVLSASEANLKQIAETIAICNKYKISWLSWNFRGYLDNYNVTSLLSQTYAMAVAGKILDQSFDPQTASYHLTFSASASCKSSTTIIYLNEDMYYPIGFTVKIIPATAGKWTRYKKNLIHLVTTNIPDGHTVQLIITK